MSEHSAHLTSLQFGFRTWLWRYTRLLLLISMLWHRQTIFESKGDKLSSSAECRIRTWKSQDTHSPADWMPTHKPTELPRIKLKNTHWTQHHPPSAEAKPHWSVVQCSLGNVIGVAYLMQFQWREAYVLENWQLAELQSNKYVCMYVCMFIYIYI